MRGLPKIKENSSFDDLKRHRSESVEKSTIPEKKLRQTQYDYFGTRIPKATIDSNF